MRSKTLRLLPCSRRNRAGLTAWIDELAARGLRFSTSLGPFGVFTFAPARQTRHVLLVDEAEAGDQLQRVGQGSVSQCYVYALEPGAEHPGTPLQHTGAFFIFFYVTCLLGCYILLGQARAAGFAAVWQWLPHSFYCLMGYCLWSILETAVYLLPGLHRPRYGGLWGLANLLHALLLPAALGLLIAGMIC